VTDFEREFPSLCFALATGVGKTRLIADFRDRHHPKYVFRGISELAIVAPSIITGDSSN
jgi:type III restriction enzyme